MQNSKRSSNGSGSARELHSDALHPIERLSYSDAKTIAYKLTIDDPKIFTAPWTQEFTMAYEPEWDKTGIYEFVCEENNRCPGGKCQGQ